MLQRSALRYTLYYSTYDEEHLGLLLSVHFDDYANAGTEGIITEFERFLSFRFDVAKSGRRFSSLLGCEIDEEKDFSVTLSKEN